MVYAEREYREGVRCQFCHALTDLFTITDRVDNVIICKDCAEKLKDVLEQDVLNIEEE